MYLTILANYFEEPWARITNPGFAWVTLFGVWSFVLLAVGTVGFNGYDYDKCPNVDRQTFIDNGTYDTLCVQDATIPVPFMATLDYGWFILLVFAPFLLPASRPLLYEQIKLAEDDPEVAAQLSEEAGVSADTPAHTLPTQMFEIEEPDTKGEARV
eukprot:TRINITY_DN2060_c0_g1_i2.p2 TRINITY_DN2060_c0_g1~~TRINITY_DN2060_c0_g1_i2.p2  ORF type:complete len:156 (+),score=34.47 TRINITY_DN2060_c0_g1_i2:576-1043(+)